MNLNLNLLRYKLDNSNVIFFDLDGTLIDTEHLYFRFWKEATKFYGRELSDEEALSMRSRDNKSAKQFLKEISGGLLDYDIVKAKRIELMDAYLKNHPIQMKPYAKEYLSKLKSEKKKVFIVTANTVEKATKIIKEVGFYDLVDGVISAKDVERGKPFPDVYLRAASIVGVNIIDIIVFEDSPNGLISSYRSGAFTVMVEDLDHYNETMNFVHSAITSFKELM